jgi:DNA-binding response OmpR family regulator
MGVKIRRKILVIADNLEVGQVWGVSLSQMLDCNYVVFKSSQINGEQLTRETIDLILVETQAAESNIISLCQRLREIAIIPVLLLHDYCNEDFILSAYRTGIDEYICKPTSPFLLSAKVQAWLNRSWTVPVETLHSLQSADLMLNPVHRQVVIKHGKKVHLTNLEFRLLYVLMSFPGRPRSIEQILDKVWGDYNGDSVQLKNLIYRLRRKIEPDAANPIYIQRLSGVGYGFALTRQSE